MFYFSTMLVLSFLGVLAEIVPSFHLPQFVKTPQREVDRYITNTLGHTRLTRSLSSFRWCLAMLYIQMVVVVMVVAAVYFFEGLGGLGVRC